MTSMTDAEWVHEVLTALGEPLGKAGMGEPSPGPGRHVIWHRDASDAVRPCKDSPVWANSAAGCYDVTVREDPDWIGNLPMLSVWTEGTELVRVPAPATATALAAVLQVAAPSISDVITHDFARFETDHNGYLPGTEPPPARP